MHSRYIYLLLIVLVGTVLLAACSSSNETPPVEQPSEPEPIEGEEPEDTPYPSTGEEIVQPAPDEAYPAPDIVEVDPYPSGREGEDLLVTSIFLASDFTPLPSDKDLQRGKVYIDAESTEIVMNESMPVQVELVLKGDLPTPCHALRVVASEPDDQNHVELEVYSVTDPEKVCIQVTSPFEATVPLGDFTKGTYSVGINGEAVTEFEIS